MKAIRITRPGRPDVLEVADVPDPAPGAGEVLVRIRAAGLNRADLLQRMGRYPPPPGTPTDIPGLEFAGQIAGLGPDVEGWSPGDRVMGLLPGAGYAELVCVPAALLLASPPGLSDVEAAAIPEVFLTAADALFDLGRLAAGETALIHSAGGGVGTAALQLARAGGAGLIIGTASSTKLAAIAETGLPMDAGVDYRTESFGQRVLEQTGGTGADVIIDTVGADYWEDNLASLATRGRWVIVGLLSGGDVSVDLRSLMRKRATVIGTVLRARSVDEKARLTDDFRRRFLPAFAADEGAPARKGPEEDPGGPALRPVLDRVFPFAEAAEAHRHMESNRNFGKIVLEVN
jgi:putative PIG3 family NAD(P)H quinone oxidoreductase